MSANNDAVTEFWIDQELLHSIHRASKIEQKVTEVFRLFRDPVYRYLIGVLGNRAEAEELTQEVFLSLYTCLRKGEAVGNCRAWVFRVAHNLAINLVKKRSQFELVDILAGDRERRQSLDRSQDAEQTMLAEERHSRVQAALARLSFQERQCLHLRAENLRFKEIAQVLGISISSVETFINRGIRKIMREIRD